MHALRSTADLWSYLNNWPDTKVRAFAPHLVICGIYKEGPAHARAVAKLASLGVLVRKGDDEWYSYRPIPMKNRCFARKIKAGTGDMFDTIHIEDARLPQYTMLCANRRVARTYECGFQSGFICHKCVKIAMRDAT